MSAADKGIMQIGYNYSARREPIKYIVVHDTGNTSKGADAMAHYNYFNGGNRKSSADFFADDKRALCVNDYYKYYSWHCGDGNGKYGITNSNSVGVEMCINADGNREMALKNTAALVRELMSELNIPIERVVRHYDASRKNCPASMSKNGWSEWYEFKEMLKGGDLTMTQYEELKAEISRLQAAVNKLNGKMIYNYVDKNMPEWARPTIQKMMDRGFLQGDENGCLGLTDELLRVFVTNDRAGMYDHRWDGKSE